VIKTVYRTAREVPVIVCGLVDLELSDRLQKSNNESNLIKIRPLGIEFSHAERWTGGQTDRQTDRQTDVTKLILRAVHC
jgi:hypothetical protein